MTFRSLLVPATADSGVEDFTEDFDGALLTICPAYGGKIYPIGTGFMVMPGLAITAAHVFSDVEKEISGSDGALFALGRQGNRLLPWVVTKADVSCDAALLQLTPKFEIPSDFTLSHFELTARLPQADEAVLALGQVSEERSYDFPGPDPLVATGVAAAGKAIERLSRGVLAAGPTVHCRFFAPGGMSGGPVFDASGRVFGLLSHSMEGEAGEPHDAHVASHWPVLIKTIRPEWPQGFYKGAASVWPSHVHNAEHFGIGKNTEGDTTFCYLE